MNLTKRTIRISLSLWVSWRKILNPGVKRWLIRDISIEVNVYLIFCCFYLGLFPWPRCWHFLCMSIRNIYQNTWGFFAAIWAKEKTEGQKRFRTKLCDSNSNWIPRLSHWHHVNASWSINSPFSYYSNQKLFSEV